MNTKLCITVMVMLAVGVSFSSNAMAQSPQGMKLYVTSSGDLNLDQGWLTAMTNHGNRIDVPVPMYIIDHPDGLVVFDTGMNIAIVPDQGAEYWGPVAGAFTPTMSRDQGIDRKLQKIGKSVEDVRYVVHSHLHLDHAGNISMFPNATHIIRKAELQNAWWPEKFQRAAYVMDDFKMTYELNIIELTQDLDLFGDGSVELIDTKGHTKGHQSMVVRLPNNGTMILASDAAYMAENLQGTVPGIVWNVQYAMESIERMKLIRDIEGGQIILSHSKDMHDSLKQLPQYYD